MSDETEPYGAWPNLAAMMFSRARQWAAKPMLRWHAGGSWRRMDWGTFGVQVASAARHLRMAGIEAGDRVVIVSENRPEFVIAETALLAIRAVPVPAYTTNTVEDHAHILRDSGARAAVVSNAAHAERVAQARPLDLLVCMEPFARAGVATIEWSELIEDNEPFEDVAAMAEAIRPHTLACIIYTSGTGGAPKGVMLSHRAILSNCKGARIFLEPLKLVNEVYLSFLPLSHAYEHTVGQFFLLSIGTEVAYARGVEHLSADMQSVKPSIMTVVPRILEVIRSRILTQVAREKPWKRALFDQAISVGYRVADGSATLLDRIADPVLERLVRQKVRERFGGRFRAAMSGGARLEPEVGKFFMGLGIVLMQGYGQTEAGPVIAANPPDAVRIATVGLPLEGVQLAFAEDGEILVRGDLVMDGYWGRPEDTAAAIRDGWLHTGDIGSLDAAGYLQITDRKRDMIVLSGGENISPARVEGLLISEPAIQQAAVFGEGRPGLAALVVATEGHDDVSVAAAVSQVNKRLSVTERIRRHAVVPAFTLENGLMTPSQKVKRHLVLKAHAGVLERLLG